MFASDIRPEQTEGQFCRLCFNKTDDLCPLFPPASIPNKVLLHKIFDCTTITLSFRDDHNAKICTSCVVSIEAFFKYKIKCVENDKLLRKQRTNFFSELGLVEDPDKVRISEPEDSEKDKTNNETGHCPVKQEMIDDDDDDEYFNPDEFLAQETQIGDKQIDQALLNGHDEHNLEHANASFERGWKTTEFSPQAGISGLKPLKITDYSNMSGKRGRPQRFITTVPTERLLARPNAYPNSFQHTPMSQSPTASALAQQGFEGAYRDHLSTTNGVGRIPMQRSNPMGGRFDSFSLSTMEQTRKVQKFLDDGLRDLIMHSGAPNPTGAIDGGSTNFKVVKARCNSYNLIFEANRFLRRNKSCSGLPKWYWACSVNGCPVKICSYRGRLYKTNDKINHTHPPTETDESQHEVVLPDQADEFLVQRQSPLAMIAPRPTQMQRAQPRLPSTSAAAVSTTGTEPTRLQASSRAPIAEEVSQSYEIIKKDDETETLIYKEHKHKLLSNDDGVRVWKCTTTTDNGDECDDTIHLMPNGKLKLQNSTKEESLSEDENGKTEEQDSDGIKRKSRAPKIAVFEGYYYKYCHLRQDGPLYWRCLKKQDTNCPVTMLTRASFELINFNEQSHNHEPPDLSEKLEHAIICNVTPAPPKPPPEPVVGSTDFQLVKSGQKREFLIYHGYRYYFQYESKNGKRSYRCTMFRNCPAGAFLLPDNTIVEAKNFVHTHPPTENLEKYVTKDSLITSPIKNVDGQPGRQQRKAIDTGQFPMLDETAISASSRAEVALANGYKIIKNYKGKDILIYNGWRYFVDYKKKNGGQVWRCSSHRLCRGTVHLFPDGSINFSKLMDHNHSPPKRNLSTPNASLNDTGSIEFYANAYSTPFHRYIMHERHRFRFATRKREGTIYWRCAMRLDTKCPVSFHTKEDTYELVSMRNHEHNHPVPDVWPEEAGGTITEELPVVKIPQEQIGTSDFILTKNSKGRDVVLYQNGRYYLDYSRKDGKVVFRCSSVAGCRATVLLLPNKTLVVNKEMMHTHGMVPMMNAMMNQSLPYANPNLTDKSQADLLRSGPPDPLAIDMEPPLSTSSPSTSSLPNLPKFIVHHGYHYKFISRNAEQRMAFWRCSNYEAKMNCQSSLYTTLEGEVIRTNNVHNHKTEDYNSATASNSLARRKTLIGTTDYKIVKNWKMRDVLVFQQCRYFLHYVRKDGRKVWRCSAIRSCHAAVYLGADGRVDQVKGEHVHDIRSEGEPRRRRSRNPRMEVLPAPQSGGNGLVPTGNGGNEWIDYSDYGMQMNSSSNDNKSLWDHLNPPHMAGAGATAGENGENFNFNYHSVFGNQPNFEDSYGMLPVADSTGLEDDDEPLPLEPDVSFHESDSFANMVNKQDLEPVVTMDGVE